MKKEMISTRSAGSLMVMTVVCFSVLMGTGTAKQDLWISLLLSALIFFPIILIYSRICALFPQKGLYEIIQSLFGKVISFFLIFIFAVYALIISALTLRNFVEFTVVIALEDTPRIILMIAIMLVVVSLVQKGMSVFGKWSAVICIVILVNILFSILLSFDTIKFSHIKPIMDHGLPEITGNATSIGAISIGETVLLMTVMGHVKSKKASYKVYLGGLLVGIITLTLVALRNLLILGPEMVAAASFTGYIAVRIIHLGTFFERLESIISFNLILMGITKIALCLTAATMGTAKLLKTADYRKLILPVSLLALAICSVVFKTAYEMFDFARIYKYIAFPIQIVIPIFIWIVAEVKVRKGNISQIEEVQE